MRACKHHHWRPPPVLQELRGESTIVFTSSVEATHRLYLLLAALGCLPDRVVEFSSLVPPPERASNLQAFRSGAAKVGLAGGGAAGLGARWQRAHCNEPVPLSMGRREPQCGLCTNAAGLTLAGPRLLWCAAPPCRCWCARTP